jgi:hypothetical protein
MYMLILNFTYLLRCLRVPPVEYQCSRSCNRSGPPLIRLNVLGAVAQPAIVVLAPDITVDRPFLVFIVDEINNLPLFTAKVADPSKL